MVYWHSSTLPQLSIAYSTVCSVDSNALKKGVATGGWDTHFKQSHVIITTATQKYCSESQNCIIKYNIIKSENAIRV